MGGLGLTELLMMSILGPLVIWGHYDGKRKKAERKAAHEAERERLYAKIKEIPELAKEHYQTIEDMEARFRGEKKKVITQVVVQGQPDQPTNQPPVQQSPLQLFKAAFKSIFN